MLLRRITKHVREQNWFAVFVDFIIVVVGVFIGIQVANWNDGIKAKQAEKIYLERIYEDIQFAQKIAKRKIDRRISGLNASLELVELMNGDGSELTENYTNCHFPSTVSIQIELPSLNTINELLATGNLNLISNHEIRNSILKLHSHLELLRRTQDFTKTEMINIADEFSDFINLRTEKDVNGEVRLQRSCNLKALHANNRFVNAINDGLDVVDAIINRYVIPWSKEIESLNDLIEKELLIEHEES